MPEKCDVVISNACVLTPHEKFDLGTIVVGGEKIISVGPGEEYADIPCRLRIDAAGHIAVPGFIDLHTHGAAGTSFLQCDAAGMQEACSFMARHGVTAFLATLIPMEWSQMLDCLQAMSGLVRSPLRGAQCLGIHLEGPFLSPRRKGAMPIERLRQPSLSDLQTLIDRADGTVRLMTIAPELDGASELVRWMRGRGVIPSIGHSDATYNQVVEAEALGITHASHTFNGMRPFRHREPGTVGGILDLEGIVAEVIGDGVHVCPAALRLLVKAKGKNKVALVTDNGRFTGLAPGLYSWDGRGFRVTREAVFTEDSSLAGSVLTMDEMIGVLVDRVGLSLQDASFLASVTPAGELGLGHSKGTLGSGKDADLVLLSEQLEVRLTMIKGKIAYKDAKSTIRLVGDESRLSDI